MIAQSGLPGRAVGNLRQPNHLASLLVWSVDRAGAAGRVGPHPALARRGVLGLLIMVAVVLSGSRTGLYGGAGVLVLWGVVDVRALARHAHRAGRRRSSFPLAVYAWQWLTTHISFMPHAVGAATRAAEGDSSHFAIWKNALEMIRQQPLAAASAGANSTSRGR